MSRITASVMSARKRLIADGLYLACAAVFLFSMYCVIYFFTAAFMATGNGLIKWGEGWKALKAFLGV